LGTGREALLVMEQQSVEFGHCLVGRSYVHDFPLMNVGDVKYPVKLALVIHYSIPILFG
jgi:hypothetical protein